MRDLTALVLAGGRGTRIAHLVGDTPKPLVPVAGKPFLEWLSLYLVRGGVRRFVFSTGYKAEQIEAWTKTIAWPDVTMETVAEPSALGTGGAVFGCLDRCGEWFLVLNGDTLAIFDLPLLTDLVGSDIDGAIAALPVSDTSRYGSLDVGADGLLRGFREKQPGAGLINAGVYLLRKQALLPLVREGQVSLETEILPELIARGGKVAAVNVGQAGFIDIGTPETLAAADEFVASRRQIFEG